jgi:ABC-type hemin transport system substrate-binding protein
MRSISIFYCRITEISSVLLISSRSGFVRAIWGEDSGEEELMAQAGGVLKRFFIT